MSSSRLEHTLDKMRRDWDERARENARYPEGSGESDTIFTFADRDCVLLYPDIVYSIEAFSYRYPEGESVYERFLGREVASGQCQFPEPTLPDDVRKPLEAAHVRHDGDLRLRRPESHCAHVRFLAVEAASLHQG